MVAKYGHGAQSRGVGCLDCDLQLLLLLLSLALAPQRGAQPGNPDWPIITRQDRGAFAALQGLSGTVACLDTTARSVDKDKAARRSQPIVAWAMTWSLPMALADRCRWPLPIVQLLLVGRPAVDNEREVICAAF